MQQANPYQPPSADVTRVSEKRKLGPLAWALVALVAAQVVLSVLNTPRVWELVGVGAVSFFSFLSIALAILLLAVGGILTVSKSRTAIYVFGFASAFAVLALLQWQPLLYVTCALLAVVACAISIVHNRQSSGR